MRVVNFHAQKFSVGKTLIIIKPYTSGNVVLSVGATGIIERITVESFPDLMLFDIRILHVRFGKHTFGLNEKLAEEYMDVV
jgi:hypothetical protein